jgi:hypothetical protein
LNPEHVRTGGFTGISMRMSSRPNVYDRTALAYIWKKKQISVVSVFRQYKNKLVLLQRSWRAYFRAREAQVDSLCHVWDQLVDTNVTISSLTSKTVIK